MADPPPFSCTEVIGEVLLAMGPDAAAVTAAWFRPGRPCPPNARCIAPPEGSAHVVVRVQGGGLAIFHVGLAGEEVAVENALQPTFDIWPPSGEAIPDVRRPAMDGAPAEVADRIPMPLCWDEGAGLFESPAARRCFLGAVLDGRPAEFHSRGVDPADGPVLELYRFAGRGPVLVYQNRPKPADPGWVRKDCAIGPAFDDTQIFVVAECLSTELS